MCRWHRRRGPYGPGLPQAEPVSLTPQEKLAGRAFLDQCQREQLELDPAAAATCTPFTVWYRHECKPSEKSVQAGTRAMLLKQHYWLSPEYRVRDSVTVPAEKFAVIFRRGQCSRCGLLVCSNVKLVLAEQTPPEKGAVIVRQPAYREVPGGQSSAAQPS